MDSSRYQAHGLVLFAALQIAVLLGCDRSDQVVQSQTAQAPIAGRLTSTSRQLESALEAVANCYQSLSSYQDDAVVELRYRVDGQPTVDRAPMNVAWDRSGRVGLRIYAILAGPTQSGRFHLRIDGRADLEHQVLSRELPAHLTFPWLLTDPVVGEELSGGLAGFPPQLELLLDPNPLARLIQGATKTSWLPEQTIDDQPCIGILIEHGSLEFKVWIDQKSQLVRRLELPTENLPPDILESPSYSDIQLSIEIHGIQINHSINWQQFDVPSQADDYRLTRFIPAPPKVDYGGYGKVVPAFQLRDAGGAVRFDSRPSPKRKAEVLLWLADHPSCWAASEQLKTAEQALIQSGIGHDEVEFVSVWAEPAPPQGLTFEQLASQRNYAGNLVVDQSAAGRDLFQIEEAPTLIVLDGQGKLQLRDVRTNPLLDQALPALIRRVVAGESLADEIAEAAEADQTRFKAELAMFAATDQDKRQQQTRMSYGPQRVQLVESARQPFFPRVQVLTQDALQNPWVLLGDGTLHRLDVNLQPLDTWHTGWVATNPARSTRLQPSADGRFIARAQDDAETIEMLNIASGQPLHFELPAGSNPIDMEWITLPSSKAPRLAVITDSKHLLLLDPENREPLSGNCSSNPVAILVSSSGSPQAMPQAIVALADGRLERIDLPNGPAADASEHISPIEKLSFEPTHGVWETGRASVGFQTIAQGLLAKGEPALFYLNERFQTLGHYRLPTATIGTDSLSRMATSPGSGAVVWAVLDGTETVHLVRGDGHWADCFRLPEPTEGIALLPKGDRLVLIFSTGDQVVAYEINEKP